MTESRTLRFPPRIGLNLVLLLACAMIGANPVSADQLSAGTGNKQVKKQAIAGIPFDRLTTQASQKISQVIRKPDFYRRLPVTSIDVDPDYFRFLVRYPEVIVNIWQLMGVTRMETERTGPYSIMTNDGAGTISNLELVYGTDDLHIFFGQGTYQGPVLKRKLNGNCVLVLRSESGRGGNGQPVMTCQLDVFLKIENATVGLVTKTIAPMVGSTADHNFVESLKFVQRLNDTTQKNGPGVQQMGRKLDLDPKIEQMFSQTVEVVFQRASMGRQNYTARQPGNQRVSVAREAYPTNHSADPNTANYQHLAHPSRRQEMELRQSPAPSQPQQAVPRYRFGSPTSGLNRTGAQTQPVAPHYYPGNIPNTYVSPAAGYSGQRYQPTTSGWGR